MDWMFEIDLGMHRRGRRCYADELTGVETR